MVIVRRVLMWIVCLTSVIIPQFVAGGRPVRAASGGGAPGSGGQVVDGGTPVSDRNCLVISSKFEKDEEIANMRHLRTEIRNACGHRVDNIFVSVNIFTICITPPNPKALPRRGSNLVSSLHHLRSLDSQRTAGGDDAYRFACGWCFGKDFQSVGRDVLIAATVAQDGGFTARSNVAHALGTVPSGSLGGEHPTPCT